MKNYVIIGGGIASVACIEGIRSIDKKGKISLISGENKPTYCRPLISYYLQNLTDFEKMKYRPDGFYAENGCELVFGKAESIDKTTKTVSVNGRNIAYDKLLVATGSTPFVPPFNGLDTVENKFTFMTENDAFDIAQAVSPQTKVLIIGAGLIGLKCAEGLTERVKSVTVSDLATRVLSSILDDECAAYMRKVLEEHGVSFVLGDSVERFEKNSAVFKSGKTVDFDVLALEYKKRCCHTAQSELRAEVLLEEFLNQFNTLLRLSHIQHRTVVNGLHNSTHCRLLSVFLSKLRAKV